MKAETIIPSGDERRTLLYRRRDVLIPAPMFVVGFGGDCLVGSSGMVEEAWKSS